MERVTRRELTLASRTADALVYTVGIAGVVAGGLFLRGGSTGFALVAFALTFVAGAALRLLSVITRGIADIKRQLDAQRDRETLPPPLPQPDPDAPPDPYRRWGGWH